jgi:hypothetical protein
MAEEHMDRVRRGLNVLHGEMDRCKIDCVNCAELKKQVEKALD